MATEALVAKAPELPEAVVRRGISESQWRTLFNLFPGGKPDSVLMAWDYCKSRQLDPMKKPCHIVPMRVKVGDDWQWRDVVMPGIYEYRITAQRTGLYLGHTEPVFGPEQEHMGVKAPAWCAMTFYRWNERASEKVPFPVKVWFSEAVTTRVDKKRQEEVVNERWSRAPIQMLTKCTEAAGLREAFPEEFGGEQTAEEMDGRVLGFDDEAARPGVKPAQRKSSAEPVVATVVEEPIQARTPTPESSQTQEPAAAEPQKAAEGAPAHVGTIADLKRPDNGGVIVTLNTGFKAGTKNTELIAALGTLADERVIVELRTRKPKDPRYAPTIEEIIPIRDGEAAS